MSKKLKNLIQQHIKEMPEGNYTLSQIHQFWNSVPRKRLEGKDFKKMVNGKKFKNILYLFKNSKNHCVYQIFKDPLLD